MVDDNIPIEDLPEIEKSRRDDSRGKFTNFWAAVDAVINENDLAVAHERRHTETSYISPLCTSLRHLTELCTTKMESLFPDSINNHVPSLNYFRLQFVPKRLNTKISNTYYGRFKLKFGLQTRTLRKAHPDQHYACKQWKLAKEFACMFRNFTLVTFWDDKAQIPIGFPKTLISAASRQRPVLMAGLDDRALNATDHDNAAQHLTPSVTIKLKPPKDICGDWYTGQPTVVLKDSIFEFSTAFRHTTEFQSSLSPEERLNPIMVFGSDGGRDHNVTCIRVILSHIALFLELDLDCLVRRTSALSIRVKD